MSKPFLVMLNGPPGSGKDFAAQTLVEANDLSVSHHKFAEPLKDMACALLEIDNKTLEMSKKQPIGLYGVTVRQLLIDMSEKWMKPCYGKDIFGKIAAERVAESMQLTDHFGEEPYDLYVFSDCGFDTEVKHVLELFGNENAILIRLHREGCTYEGDSRSYIELSDARSVDIMNDGDERFPKMLINIIKDWMKERKNDAQP